MCRPWPSASPAMSASGLSKRRLKRVNDCLNRYVERGEVTGAVGLVCRHGEAHVAAVGTMDKERRAPMKGNAIFRIMSMTKPILAVAALILIEEGRLRLDDPVDPWLPELADRKVLRSIDSPLDDVTPAKRAITVRDLLIVAPGDRCDHVPAGQLYDPTSDERERTRAGTGSGAVVAGRIHEAARAIAAYPSTRRALDVSHRL